MCLLKVNFITMLKFAGVLRALVGVVFFSDTSFAAAVTSSATNPVGISSSISTSAPQNNNLKTLSTDDTVVTTSAGPSTPISHGTPPEPSSTGISHDIIIIGSTIGSCVFLVILVIVMAIICSKLYDKDKDPSVTQDDVSDNVKPKRFSQLHDVQRNTDISPCPGRYANEFGQDLRMNGMDSRCESLEMVRFDSPGQRHSWLYEGSLEEQQASAEHLYRYYRNLSHTEQGGGNCENQHEIRGGRGNDCCDFVMKDPRWNQDVMNSSRVSRIPTNRQRPSCHVSRGLPNDEQHSHDVSREFPRPKQSPYTNRTVMNFERSLSINNRTLQNVEQHSNYTSNSLPRFQRHGPYISRTSLRPREYFHYGSREMPNSEHYAPYDSTMLQTRERYSPYTPKLLSSSEQRSSPGVSPNVERHSAHEGRSVYRREEIAKKVHDGHNLMMMSTDFREQQQGDSDHNDISLDPRMRPGVVFIYTGEQHA